MSLYALVKPRSVQCSSAQFSSLWSPSIHSFSNATREATSPSERTYSTSWMGQSR